MSRCVIKTDRKCQKFLVVQSQPVNVQGENTGKHCLLNTREHAMMADSQYPTNFLMMMHVLHLMDIYFHTSLDQHIHKFIYKYC